MDKINQLRSRLKQLGLDGLLISNFYNLVYLTGFKTLTKDEREAWGLVTKDNTYIFSDGRYIYKDQSSKIKVQNRNSKFKIQIITPERGLIFYLQEIIRQENILRLGFEGENLRVNELRKLEEKLPIVKFISTEKVILKQREIKTDDEIEKVKKACQIGDQCLKAIISTLKLNQTEKEIAFNIEYWLKEKGYGIAFQPLVAIDKNSAIPHYDSGGEGSNRIKRSSIVLIDFGVNHQDYLSDMTRMVFFGKPTVEQINVYNQLQSIQEKAIKQSNNVNNFKEIDQFCRDLIKKGQLPNIPHSIGHGIGLEIHEYPKVSQNSTDILQPNQVFTIEPGVYFPKKWGMRIEDTVFIDKDLRPYNLTKFPKSLLII